jgi:hypothetical protein
MNWDISGQGKKKTEKGKRQSQHPSRVRWLAYTILLSSFFFLPSSFFLLPFRTGATGDWKRAPPAAPSAAPA